jgi:hypothetical protein
MTKVHHCRCLLTVRGSSWFVSYPVYSTCGRLNVEFVPGTVMRICGERDQWYKLYCTRSVVSHKKISVKLCV